jgi:hypothetical protein
MEVQMELEYVSEGVENEERKRVSNMMLIKGKGGR